MIGIKGTGMSALAINLKHMGFGVTGSDHPETFFTDLFLKKHGLKAKSPFAARNIPHDTDLVVSSTAYNTKNNAELAEAEQRGLKALSYPEMLGVLTRELKSIAVCGSHGKTTTSGILSFILSKTKYRPIVNVGSIVPQLVNYRPRDPRLLVFEADEYQNKFKFFHPKIVILTNIDFDHPDYFRDLGYYKSVFRKFIERIPKNGLLIFCADDKNCRNITKNAVCAKISYGLSRRTTARINVAKILPDKMVFFLNRPDKKVCKFTSKLIGEHNALNLGAASICADYLGISEKQIKNAVASFTGTKRRMERIKKVRINGYSCIVMDDFAHHPTEIRSTIKALKIAYPSKTLWTIFQPHTFSRTQALFNDFAESFNQSNFTIVLDIYPSKRETEGSIHSTDLIKKMHARGGGVFDDHIYYKANIKLAADFLKKSIKSDSLILTIGASNVWELANLL